jgi:hypothetical protein
MRATVGPTAGGPTVHGGRPRLPRAALIAAAVVIVLAGGAFGALKAFSSPGKHDTAASVVTRGTPTAAATSTPTNAPTRASTSQTGVQAVSGASGSSSTTRYDSLDALGSGSLAPAGTTAGIPYFEPAKGDWDSLGGIQRCKTIGTDQTTEAIICIGLFEGNSGGGVTWYTPGLTAYCETISTGKDVQCAEVTGTFGMYSATGVQESPVEYSSCDRARGNLCSTSENYFVDTDDSSWMTVNTAAADSCQHNGGTGTDCQIHPYAYAGLVIELPGTDKNVTMEANYRGASAIGY